MKKIFRFDGWCLQQPLLIASLLFFLNSFVRNQNIFHRVKQTIESIQLNKEVVA